MDLHGSPWISMDLHGSPWFPGYTSSPDEMLQWRKEAAEVGPMDRILAPKESSVRRDGFSIFKWWTHLNFTKNNCEWIRSDQHNLVNLVGGWATPLKHIRQLERLSHILWENKECLRPPTSNSDIVGILHAHNCGWMSFHQQNWVWNPPFDGDILGIKCEYIRSPGPTSYAALVHCFR